MSTWNLSSAIASRNEIVEIIWICAAPLLCALLGAREAWLVPIGIIVADVATQHLAGVPWWDVWNNEAWIIVILGLLEGFTSLGVGLLVRRIVL